MKALLAILLVGACIAMPCVFAAERFTSDKPTPLTRLKPSKDDGNGARFGGSVQLSGQFFIVREKKNDRPLYWQVTFFPDAGSAALLPHPVGEKAVTELDFTNREQAAAMLRDLVTLETALARHQTGSAGAATVTIRNYRTEVECDHRWYLAELVSVVKDKQMVVSARDAHPGC
jgi:hypothetical protein